jgi:putative transposase
MNRKHYPSDLTDEEWTILAPLIPPAKAGGRPRTADMREVFNAIFYVLKTGCQWDRLPPEFPPKGTVFHYYNTWRKSGVWREWNAVLREKLPLDDGREAASSTMFPVSQTIPPLKKQGLAPRLQGGQ